MIIKTNNLKLEDKGIFEGVSKKTGNAFKMYQLYVNDGEIITKIMANEVLFNKAEKGKVYQLKFYINPNGQINLNDIELVK